MLKIIFTAAFCAWPRFTTQAGILVVSWTSKHGAILFGFVKYIYGEGMPPLVSFSNFLLHFANAKSFLQWIRVIIIVFIAIGLVKTPWTFRRLIANATLLPSSI